MDHIENNSAPPHGGAPHRYVSNYFPYTAAYDGGAGGNGTGSVYQIAPPTAVGGSGNAGSKGGALPKNFTQPLTCFYWHTYGFCKKSDEGCMYAHWPTGIVAAAPVSIRGARGAIAGRNASEQLNAHTEREDRLQRWEARLVASQKALGEQMLNKEAQILELRKLFEGLETAFADGRHLLEAAKENTENLKQSIDDVIKSMADIELKLVELKKMSNPPRKMSTDTFRATLVDRSVTK